jgi:hypothetical protein
LVCCSKKNLATLHQTCNKDEMTLTKLAKKFFRGLCIFFI